MGVIACRKETLQLKLTQHKELTAQLKLTRYLHVVRAYNASSDVLATEALESQVTKVVLSESRKAELKATRSQNSTAEESQVTAVTRSQSRRVRFAESTKHRPTSQKAVNEVDDLPANHESPISLQGGAQRSAREGTGNLETTLDEPVIVNPEEASVREDPTPVQTDRIRRVRVAQDEERRWVDLKAYLRGEVESLSFKRAANAGKLVDSFVLDEDGLLQYVGKGRKLVEVSKQEPQLRLEIPTTMIDEVLQSCHDSIEGGHQGITCTFHRVKKDYYWVGRSRATLSYRPQANRQQERSVKSIVQTVNIYVEDPLQQDWNDIAEKMVHAINNSMDTTRKEAPFYLVHGWDAQSTLKAMTCSLRLGDGRLPVLSRFKPVREANRRPTAELVDGIGEDDRFDFDEELLPEDSWELEAGRDEYVVEDSLDDRWPISTGTERTKRKFDVKWRGYDDPTWEPVSNLSCRGFLFEYLLQRKRENRLQMVQVADES
ncbi:unnamed protein product [Phytophthora fragariaefolia]|uniref:Unnamed protein product n=1 Tax=Phytophthora fragariaefolia TaxID=1490495 RepID=A0A9W6TMY9_9STRA|nr:unnamed protein product [Phytophthora fragariaefolia]